MHSSTRPGFFKQVRLWADSRRHIWFARALLLLYRGGPQLVDAETVRSIRAQKARRRASVPVLADSRAQMVSIGVFGCGRFDLLQRTCASLEQYLARYGDAFAHEVLFFHDGPNPEIEQWAHRNALFDRVYFNTENQGLSYNLNRFWFEESKGAFLLPLEDDWVCEFKDDFLSHALDILESDAAVGIVRQERKYPGDYREWDKAFKIEQRFLSAEVYMTKQGHPYRLLFEQPNGEGVYANSCGLLRYDAVLLAGRLRDDKENRRAQEPEYMRKFNPYWLAARGIGQADSPFLHTGYGRSVSAWKV